MYYALKQWTSGFVSPKIWSKSLKIELYLYFPGYANEGGHFLVWNMIKKNGLTLFLKPQHKNSQVFHVLIKQLFHSRLLDLSF